MVANNQSRQYQGRVNGAGVRALLADLGEEIVPRDQQTPEWLGAFHKAEFEKWLPIIKAAKMKGE